MMTSQLLGPLVIIGGAEDKRGESMILREFIRLAGGPQARILIVTVASEWPRQVGGRYLEVFDRLGAGAFQTLDISGREEANGSAAIQAVEQATGVFFSGGNQIRVTRLLGGTRIDQVLHRRHQEGLVLAGTSAGAAMMPDMMITGGIPDMPARVGGVEVSPGMAFISGVLIDQHFGERGRLRRLLAAVAQYPHHLGIGIDEDTAIIVHEGEFAVIGERTVTVIDAGNLTYTNLPELGEHEILALFGLKLHILPAGYRFDLVNRIPIAGPDVATTDRT